MDMKLLAQKAHDYTEEFMPFLGINKKREIARLLFEIAKRDGVNPADILPEEFSKNFDRAKKYLLPLRYPESCKKTPPSAYYLPKLDLDFVPDADIENKEFYPKEIYIEKDAAGYPLAKRVKELFPAAVFKESDKKTIAGSNNYSRRKDILVITKENFDFIKPCPCTKACVCCGYNLVNLGFGCAYECNYCFLQQYQNMHAIVLPANINDFLEKIKTAKLTKGSFPYIRIGSGEFTDSLLFDHITQYSKDIVEFFRGRPEYFEFKTKSVNIKNLLDIKAAPNIVIGWSVNPQNIIDAAEPLTPPLKERLAAAAQAAKHGYKTAFHFDPVILHHRWRQSYRQAVEEIARTVPPQSIMWISIGTLRFNRDLKKFIEARFKQNTILDEEFILDFDGKMRYPAPARQEAYKFLQNLLKENFPRAHIYLCMESADLHK